MSETPTATPLEPMGAHQRLKRLARGAVAVRWQGLARVCRAQPWPFLIARGGPGEGRSFRQDARAEARVLDQPLQCPSHVCKATICASVILRCEPNMTLSCLDGRLFWLTAFPEATSSSLFSCKRQHIALEGTSSTRRPSSAIFSR